jgi:deoxyribodipyrimidine photo-lyase
MPSRAVVWFRRDLRVADHPALLAALDTADQVVPVFVVDHTLLDGRPSGPNRRAFLHGALLALARDLEALGGRLLLGEGDPVTVIPALTREAAADAVYCSREYTPTPAAATLPWNRPCAPTAAPSTPCQACT